MAESDAATQSKIKVIKKYNFGLCDLIIAVPDVWIDVQTIADLEEISFLFKEKKNKRLRVATKYPNLTKNFLYSKGITQFQILKSLGSTEVAPFTNFSEVISEITQTGKTIEENANQILNFTREIKNLQEKDKIKIIKSLWRIIYSNKDADIYETNLMRRLSGLLYIDSKTMGDIKKQIMIEN